jgi:hypothetical protein
MKLSVFDTPGVAISIQYCAIQDLKDDQVKEKRILITWNPA